MSWNYRVMHKAGQLAVYSVYYDDAGKVISSSILSQLLCTVYGRVDQAGAGLCGIALAGLAGCVLTRAEVGAIIQA